MEIANAFVIQNEKVIIDENFLSEASFIELSKIIRENKQVEISEAQKEKIIKSHKAIIKSLKQENKRVYGVNTGFGQNAKVFLSSEENTSLQQNLIEYLDAATGEETNYFISRLTLLLRIINFSRGYSGVSLDLIERLILFFNRDYTPVIPYEGSLGASGDLIPLAKIGSCLQGKEECYAPFGEGTIKSSEVLQSLGIEPFVFKGKDALGLVNGTPLMTALAINNLVTLENLLEQSIENIANIYKSQGYQLSFLSTDIHEVSKPHAGQITVARKLRALTRLEGRTKHESEGDKGFSEQPMQAPYSIRCVPQVLGALEDIIQFSKGVTATEAYSVNDNPIVSPEDESIFSGGNFYGGHIAMAMDALKGQIVQMGSLLDRQILLLCDDRTNLGLNMNLSKTLGTENFWDHGLKGLHQYATSLFCELSSSATISAAHTRSTETHNQDLISLGTHAAKQVERLLVTLKKITAIHTIISARVQELRSQKLTDKYQKIIKQLETLSIRQVLAEVEKELEF